MNRSGWYVVLVSLLIGCGGASAERCGIENCHGLEVQCGPNIAEVCTEMYALGDRCRRHARCETVDDRCQLRTSEEFNSCVACVVACKEEHGDDLPEVFACESNCQ